MDRKILSVDNVGGANMNPDPLEVAGDQPIYSSFRMHRQPWTKT